MALEELLVQTEARFKKAIDALKHDVATVRTGRAAPSLVEQLEVEAYGVPTPLIQLAQINAPEPRQILIQPYDRGLIKAIEKAIQSSDLGLAPNTDGAARPVLTLATSCLSASIAFLKRASVCARRSSSAISCGRASRRTRPSRRAPSRPSARCRR